MQANQPSLIQQQQQVCVSPYEELSPRSPLMLIKYCFQQPRPPQRSMPSFKQRRASNTLTFLPFVQYVPFRYCISWRNLLTGRQSDSPGANPDSGNGDSSNKDVYVADGDYIKDIEINDLRNRYTLTKGSTQQMVTSPIATAHLPDLVSRASSSDTPGTGPSTLPALLVVCDWIDFTYTNQNIASQTPSIASANLRCLNFRSKMNLAPVRLI